MTTPDQTGYGNLNRLDFNVGEFGHHRCLDLSIRTQTKGRSGGGALKTLGKRNVFGMRLWELIYSSLTAALPQPVGSLPGKLREVVPETRRSLTIINGLSMINEFIDDPLNSNE